MIGQRVGSDRHRARPGPTLASVRDDELAAVRSSYEALNRGDIEATMAILAPDVEWRESAALPDTGTFRGREAVRSFLEDFLEQWQQFHQEVEDVVVEGDRAALLIHLTARGRGSGADVDARYAHLWTLRDGVGVRVEAYYDRDAALRSLTSP
jgi:ketosteroid isomerase-like protein